MSLFLDGLSSDLDDPDRLYLVPIIVDFWNRLRVCDETGKTSWEVLEPLEREVTECLSSSPRDLGRAWSITAKAMLLITGQYDL